MKRIVKNIIMLLLIAALGVLIYFTIEIAKGNISLGSINNLTVEAKVIFKNEENITSIEAIDENGEVTTTVTGTDTGEETTTDDVTEEVNPDETVTTTSSEDEILYTTTDSDDLTSETGDTENAIEKSLALVNSEISYKYYLIIAAEGLAIGLLFSYLAFSKFNKLSFKEVFSPKKIVIYYLLYSILLAASVIIAAYHYLI